METKDKIGKMIRAIELTNNDFNTKDWNPEIFPGTIKPNRLVQTNFSDDESILVAFFSNINQIHSVPFKILDMIQNVLNEAKKEKSVVLGDYKALIMEIEDIMSGKSR